MVLCKYFQTDSCRFGSKCNNEHVDVRQLVKPDVEIALNKNQWPLSCFGPFKEKPCIPNFIEDKSFEEVRYLCYTSKKQNFFQQFHEQFTREVMEAKTKMQALLAMTPDVVNILINLYDTPVEGNKTVSTANPFGLNSSQQMNFSPSTETRNLFNSNFTSATSGNKLFSQSISAGGFTNNQQSQQQQQQRSIFSQQQPNNLIFASAASPSIFSQQQTPQSGSIFGQTQLQHQPVTGLFSQTIQQTTPQFAQHQMQQPQIHPFGTTPAQNVTRNDNLFSQSQPPSGLFASAAAQVTAPQQQSFQQQMQMQSQNIFSQNQSTQETKIQQPQSQMQQNNNQQIQNANVMLENNIFSKMENLSAEEIEAFKADKFILGKIPTSPPPRELV